MDGKLSRASLVAQCLRICLAVEGTLVGFWVWKDPVCCGAAKPVYSYCAFALEPASCNC